MSIKYKIIVVGALVVFLLTFFYVKNEKSELSSKNGKVNESRIEVNKEYKIIPSKLDNRNNQKTSTVKDIEAMPEHKKLELIKKVVQDDLPWHPKFDGRWNLIEELDNPKIALDWALHEYEPFDDQILFVLERTLSLSDEKEEKFKIAALLYRYGSNLGKEYLLDQLKELNEDAALILASNQEKKSIDGLIKIINSGNYSKELVEALSLFGEKTTNFINSQITSNDKNKSDFIRALSFSSQKILPETEIYLDKKFDKYENDNSRIIVASAFKNSKNVNTNKYDEYLKSKLKTFDSIKSYSAKIALIKAYENTSDPAAIDISKKIINGYIETNTTTNLDELHFSALNYLLNINNKNIELAKTVLIRRQEKSINSDPEKIDYELVDLIYNSGISNSEILIEEVMGKKYLEGFLTSKKLNDLPAKYLPSYTQSFIGDRSY
ncbi:MAG: hypothetical protein ACRENO_00545 [Thermodesulfobacteriota bacterium]